MTNLFLTRAKANQGKEKPFQQLLREQNSYQETLARVRHENNLKIEHKPDMRSETRKLQITEEGKLLFRQIFIECDTRSLIYKA